jgi:hypothetical protein
LILNNDSDRFNIISYTGLSEIYKFEKNNLILILIILCLDFMEHGESIKEIIGKTKKNTITDEIINNFVTKETFYFPEYMVFY